METRRIRRLQRRRWQRTAVLATTVAVIGMAVGTALPQSTTTSVLLLAGAACCLAVVVMRDERVAPLHGLHRVVRLPLATSISASLDSFRSRLIGTVATLARRLRPRPTPVVLDEADDESEAWWGTAAAAPSSESLLESRPEPPPEAEPAAPALPEPVLAAPMQTAHVPADGSVTARQRLEQLWLAARRHLEPRWNRSKRTTEEVNAST